MASREAHLLGAIEIQRNSFANELVHARADLAIANELNASLQERIKALQSELAALKPADPQTNGAVHEPGQLPS